MSYAQKRRTNGLFKGLRVHERFRALVKSFNEGKGPSRELVAEMPPEQFDELMLRMDIYDGINDGLFGYLGVTAERLKMLRAFLLVASERRRWGHLALVTRVYLNEFSPEPILRSTLV